MQAKVSVATTVVALTFLSASWCAQAAPKNGVPGLRSQANIARKAEARAQRNAPPVTVIVNEAPQQPVKAHYGITYRGFRGPIYGPGIYYGGIGFWNTRPVQYATYNPAPPIDPALLAQQQAQAAQVFPLGWKGDLARHTAQNDLAAAETALRDYLNQENPEDMDALRSLGLVLFARGQRLTGISLVHSALQVDSGLATVGVSAPAEGADLRDLVRDAVRFAHDDQTAEAWLLVTVLMQAEGRNLPAQRMLKRAEDLGLDPTIVAALQAALQN